ncbi:hypothetical protein MIT9_P2024 [Methylomarinovum caldicuralii]|uniref:Peptidase S54 rhomboid domain-containing protein n=1 Tax=Methylomarinovum caldicuralii TaxID=438856 RepID=A0AAU9C3Z2_9GAMM|nr:rhomboid family intramembrane serine protease [Methylomarinovum caldicuralii]BCX82438.1 hypothetical protein MIT9_P2024 [Methylomarinovum caldicuralii]
MIPLRDTIPCHRTPWVTWCLIGVNVTIFLYLWWLPEEIRLKILYLYGLVPARYTHPEWAAWVGLDPNDYWPFLANLFLHGGWLHIIFNAWLLWIFGDNVEDRMGSGRFLVYYLLCGLIANGVHMAINADATIAAVGASGAIAGVMAAYFYLFPHAQVIVWIFPFPLFIPVPAILFLGLWVIFQAYQATTTGAGAAWWGHLGGFAAGFLLHRFFIRGETDHDPA